MGSFKLKDDKLINNFEWFTFFWHSEVMIDPVVKVGKQFVYFGVLLLSCICEFTEYEITSKLLVMDEARL